MKRPFRLLALSCGVLTSQFAWPLGVAAEQSILSLRQPAAMSAAAHDRASDDGALIPEPAAGAAAFDIAMLQPGEAEEAEGDEDAETDDEAIDAEGYGPAPASGPYPKPKPKNPCAESHKNLFYLNDFSYLKDPAYNGHCFGDQLKLMPLGIYNDWGTLDVGGQYRLQYKHEVGMGNAVSGPGTRRFEDTEFDLFLNRMRLYGNWRMDEANRIYVEGIYADTTTDDGRYRPRITDDNFGDLLNCFYEHSIADGMWTARLGRQEMLFGAQRLMSPLDWANTRRTFEGAMLLYEDGPWSIDTFYTAFVPPVANEFDTADWQQQVYGSYAVYTHSPNNTLDLYYFGYDDRRPGEIVSDFSLHTFGSRLFRTFENNWMFETEGGIQLGRQMGLGQDQRAGFATVGVGRKAPDHEWKPELWTYFDYASGNDGGDDFTRFNQLFPLGHKYFGFIDAVARSNIQSPNVLLTAKPPQTNWELLCWYWYFRADQRGDIVPALGATENQSLDARFLGQELDLIGKYVIGPRSNILFGYSHFWRGDKILAPQDADFAYSQWEVNF